METQELLEYVNSELAKGKNLTQLARELGKNESTIRKRLNKEGYRRVGDEFIKITDEIPNTTCSTTKKIDKKQGNITPNTTCSTTKNIEVFSPDIDMQKLKLLLDNIDILLKAIPNTTCSTTDISINTENTKVTSLRINEDIYNLVKDRAMRDKCSISDIVNKSLMDYLKNYL